MVQVEITEQEQGIEEESEEEESDDEQDETETRGATEINDVDVSRDTATGLEASEHDLTQEQLVLVVDGTPKVSVGQVCCDRI